MLISWVIRLLAFQLTRSRGAWQLKCATCTNSKDFNSHAHVERDVATNMVYYRYSNFNSHAHVERDTGDNRWECCNNYFNSHAHVERDSADFVIYCIWIISTHTLTWSVTQLSRLYHYILKISTHTLTWSVTIRMRSGFSEGSFQLTRSRGAWPWRTLRLRRRRQFQLTRSRGAWRIRLWGTPWRAYFNSHAHVERDHLETTPQAAEEISTHTLTWSVTRYCPFHLSAKRISTHTLTWSVTERIWKPLRLTAISTHTLTWSVTISADVKTVNNFISTHTLTWSVTTPFHFLRTVYQFQLTRSRGAWLGTYYTFSANLAISTHTLTWSVTAVYLYDEWILCISTHTLTWSVTK